jgi:polyhydroxyalkanoate synthesis regulator phasin
VDAATVVSDTASAGYEALKSKGEVASETMTRGAGRPSSEDGHGFGLSVRQNFTQTLERQPLLLGVIGLAIGAGIASAFRSTQVEQHMMGQAGAAVKEKIQEIVTETSEFASQRAKDVFDEVKKEAAAQGLTPASAKESLKKVVEKVTTAATSSRNSIKGRLS